MPKYKNWAYEQKKHFKIGKCFIFIALLCYRIKSLWFYVHALLKEEITLGDRGQWGSRYTLLFKWATVYASLAVTFESTTVSTRSSDQHTPREIYLTPPPEGHFNNTVCCSLITQTVKCFLSAANLLPAAQQMRFYARFLSCNWISWSRQPQMSYVLALFGQARKIWTHYEWMVCHY